MPIFQDDIGRGQKKPPPTKSTIPPLLNSPPPGNMVARKLSEESIRTELCEGPLFDSPQYPEAGLRADPEPNFAFPDQEASDRELFIKELKKGKNKAWWPNNDLESLLHHYDQPARTSSPEPMNKPSLLPSPQLLERDTPMVDIDRLQAGQEIERPRSALHSGDFTERPSHGTRDRLEANAEVYTSERQEWIATSPPRNFYPFQLDSGFLPEDILDASRSRAASLSSSYSSSFVLKPPTSPLVQSETNDDVEFSPLINPINITPHHQRNPRRHTLQASHSIHSTPSIPSTSSFNRPLPHLRRDGTLPYQAHQPRRSLTANQMPLLSSSPHASAFSRRRPSYTSDSSSLHASMVGSYEESIIRGRMSTTPSKPLDFVAQIGVLGLGKCKPALRCPAHVTIPFPAVFYSYESTPLDRGGKSEDGPSPYVGQIDLENNLPNPDEVRETRRKKHSTNTARIQMDDLDMIDRPSTSEAPETKIKQVGKQKRISTSARAPPGGSYRIPETGQLQIIIKNPNKTAVKLFLVPYDLTGMEPGTKTFIRQRSYSTGPIIDSMLSSSPQVPRGISSSRPTLRYLVHFHICSPSRGRFYLYKSIRVVFANRVPDGKEKLRNEISIPDPRFTTYKPGRDSSLGLTLGGAAATLTADKAFRRRSSGFTLGSSLNPSFDVPDRAIPSAPLHTAPSFPHAPPHRSAPTQPFPSPSSSPLSSDSSWSGGYGKLSRGDVGYGGNASPEARRGAEGLLARKLRGMGVCPSGVQDRLDGVP